MFRQAFFANSNNNNTHMRKALLLATVLVVATAAAVKAQAPLSPKKMNAAKEAALDAASEALDRAFEETAVQ